MADWIHIGGKSTTLTPGERRILDKLRSGQTESQIRHDLQIAIGELVDAIASIKSKGYSTEQVQERRTRKMTEEKIARAKELRAQGCTLSHIGRELGVSAVTVKNVLDKAKEEQEVPPAPAPEAPEERVPGSVLRCILRLISHQLLDAINGMPEEQRQAKNFDELIKSAVALTRAVAYKKQVDVRSKELMENGADQFAGALFDAMAAERPDLYKQLRAFLDSKKEKSP